MENTSRIFEIIMLLCFGSSWPFAVAKTFRTKVVKGKSPVFLVLIFIGYMAGISNKLATSFDHVIWLYCLNGSMVLTEIILYIKYEKPNVVKLYSNFIYPIKSIMTTSKSISGHKTIGS